MGNVTRLPAREKGRAPNEVTAAEMRSLLAWMGLDQAWLARRLRVDKRTVMRWCDGSNPVPEYGSVELVRLWNHAADSIKVIVDAAVSEAVDGLITLRTFGFDDDYYTMTGSKEYPAGWHRALTCRAMDHILMRTRYQVVIQYFEMRQANATP